MRNKTTIQIYQDNLPKLKKLRQILLFTNNQDIIDWMIHWIEDELGTKK
jgi:hypothetical protein